MSFKWNYLKITSAELDTVFETNLICEWAIAFCRVSILHQPQYSKELLLTQSTLFFICSLFLFSVNLIIYRKLELINSNYSGLVNILVITLCLSILLLFIFNYYLWSKAKQLKSIAVLLSKVERYNKLIDSFQLLSPIDPLNNIELNTDSQSVAELKAAFNLTKNSLLKSIELESFIYHHQNSSRQTYVYHPEQLLINLENDLAELSATEISHDEEYQELFTEAVDLGLSVHKETRKLWSLR
jgi:hypothetical protein